MILNNSEIISAIKSRLSPVVASIVGDRIFEARMISIQPEEIPCVNIVPGTKTFRESNDETLNNTDRAFTIIVYVNGDEKQEVSETTNDTVYEKMEALESLIRNEFNNIYENLDKLVYRMKIKECIPEIDRSVTDWVYGKMYMRYMIQTKDKVTDPKQIQ